MKRNKRYTRVTHRCAHRHYGYIHVHVHTQAMHTSTWQCVSKSNRGRMLYSVQPQETSQVQAELAWHNFHGNIEEQIWNIPISVTADCYCTYYTVNTFWVNIQYAWNVCAACLYYVCPMGNIQQSVKASVWTIHYESVPQFMWKFLSSHPFMLLYILMECNLWCLWCNSLWTIVISVQYLFGRSWHLHQGVKTQENNRNEVLCHSFPKEVLLYFIIDLNVIKNPMSPNMTFGCCCWIC